MKKTISKIALSVFMIACGMAMGVFIGDAIVSLMGENYSFAGYFLWLLIYLALLYAAYFVHIIVHECGHLVFGLISGYEFSSFRIGSVIITKEEGKLRFSRYALAGTSGQCLLSPPKSADGKIPYKLYNLGGVAFNLILALLSLILYFAFPKIPVLSVVFMESFAVGMFTAALNGIPMRGLLNNDGQNALSLSKDEHALVSFANQLSVNGRMAKGERLRDMPEELFELAEGADASNPINNTIIVFRCNRLMDEHRFGEARELCEKLMADESVMPIYKNMLACDLAFCEMLAGEEEKAKSRFTDAQNKFMAAMAKNPSIMRTQYAHALICQKDAAKAEKYLADFEKTAKRYPYAGDIESERELIEEAKRAVNL